MGAPKQGLGARVPDREARVLLTVIDHDSEVVMRAVDR